MSVDEAPRERASKATKTKGRGFQRDSEGEPRHSGLRGNYDAIDADDDSATNISAQKSVEGWVIIITGVHQEAQEDDVYDIVAEHGEVKQLQLNLDRRTGFVKGYALVEYAKYKEAQAAVDGLNGMQLLTQTITAAFAFKRPSDGSGAAAGRRVQVRMRE